MDSILPPTRYVAPQPGPDRRESDPQGMNLLFILHFAKIPTSTMPIFQLPTE